MHKWTKLSAVAVIALSVSPCATFAKDMNDLPLERVADVRLSGGTGRFDYLSIDPAAHRLFISHMGAGEVIVFDTAARHEIDTLKGFPGATGITYVPSLDRVFVSVTGHWWNSVMDGGEVAAVNAKTLKTLWKTRAGRFPDGSAFVPGVGRLYVSDESGGQELVLDATSGHLLDTIALHGEAGMSAFDPVSGRVLVNVQTRDKIAVIDPTVNGITRQYALPTNCHNNHGLLIDAPSRRAFVSCDGNAKLLVFDLNASRVVQTFDVGKEPDVLALDPVRHRLYVASESGIVTIFNTASQNIVKLGDGYAGDNAHSIAFDPSTGLVYLPLRDIDGHPALRIMRPILDR